MSVITDTIIVLSTPACQRCKTVARHLDNKDVEFTYVDVHEDEEWANWMRENNFSAVPITISGGTIIHGVDFDAINRLF